MIALQKQEDKAKTYWKQKYTIYFFSLFLGVVFLVLIYFSGVSEILAGSSYRIAKSYYPALFLYLLFFFIFYRIFNLPLLYFSFILEKKYSLSNQKTLSWFFDLLKSDILSFIFSLILIGSLYFLLQNIFWAWWLLLAFIYLFFTLFISRLFPVLILPLFFKYKDIKNEDVKNAIAETMKKAKVQVADVFEIDFSKKTKKSNAAVIGIGPKKRLIIADNLIRNFTIEEIKAVLAHELAHYKYNHIWRLIILNSTIILLTFYLMDIAAVGIFRVLGINNIYDIKAFPIFAVLFYVFSFIFMPFQNAYSRKIEQDADRFSVQIVGKDQFIHAMERLSAENLADINPPFIIKILLYSHPTIKERINFARRIGELTK